MGLTVSRKTAKSLAVRRKNERILTVSRKKVFTVKKSNHKIRSRDLLLSLMCHAFMCSGSENCNRNRNCRKCLHNLSHGCRCASWQTFWQLYYFTNFYFLSCWLVPMAVLNAIVSLYLYPVPQTGMSFKDVRFMTPLSPDELSKGEEKTMKDWLKNYRPVRQRTVRSETTKDKVGTLLRQCIQMQILMPLQGSSFQLTKLNKRPLLPLRCALLFPMCP